MNINGYSFDAPRARCYIVAGHEEHPSVHRTSLNFQDWCRTHPSLRPYPTWSAEELEAQVGQKARDQEGLERDAERRNDTHREKLKARQLRAALRRYGALDIEECDE